MCCHPPHGCGPPNTGFNCGAGPRMRSRNSFFCLQLSRAALSAHPVVCTALIRTCASGGPANALIKKPDVAVVCVAFGVISVPRRSAPASRVKCGGHRQARGGESETQEWPSSKEGPQPDDLQRDRRRMEQLWPATVLDSIAPQNRAALAVAAPPTPRAARRRPLPPGGEVSSWSSTVPCS